MKVLATATATATATVAATAATFVLTNSAYAGPIDDLTFFTEEYPPYNMTDGDAKQGIAVELTAAILEEADTDKSIEDIEFVPWARGYQTALRKPNTVLFSTTRTESRENRFAWVGPIAATRIGIIGPKDAPDAESLDDLYDARIATIRDDVAEQMLFQNAFPQDSIHSTSNLRSIVRLLENGRVDYWAYETNVSMHALKKHGASAAYETKFVLTEAELYYALNKDSDPAAVSAFEDAFETVRASERYDAIIDKYLK